MSITGQGTLGVTIGLISGSGAANEVTLWDGTSTVTGNAGFTWSGTGPTFDAALGRALRLGAVSTTTGQLRLANAASANLTTIQAGNAAAARTYTWPTNFGAAGTVLTDAAGNGTLSWAAGGGGSAPFSDATAIVKNAADATKLIKLDASGITAGETIVGYAAGTAAAPHFGFGGSPLVTMEVVGNTASSVTDSAILRLRNSANSAASYSYIEGGYTNGGGAFVGTWELGQTGANNTLLYGTNPIEIFANGNQRFLINSAINVYVSVLPSADASFDLGSATKNFATGYINNIRATGLQAFATNAAALLGGLVAGDLFYTDTAGEYFVKVTHA